MYTAKLPKLNADPRSGCVFRHCWWDLF